MATRITLPIQNIEGKGSQYFDVKESLPAVLTRLIPDEAPNPEQVRRNLTFTKDDDGKSVVILPTERGWWVEEL